MPTIEFNRSITTEIEAPRLWQLFVEAFQDPSTSPLWPVELEETETTEVREGSSITATYKIGPLRVRPSYHFVDVDPPRSLRYQSDEDHPLDGGATVRIEPTREGSTLHWTGSYRPRLHPMAPLAYLFVRLYFLGAFFKRLEANLDHLASADSVPRTRP